MIYDLSIITVCYNCASSIERTIKSVLAQKEDSVQYIVIDGASSDGTLDVLKQYHNKINILVSEPDEGLYYAMNKGVELAEGKYLLFINAGDILLPNSLQVAKKEFQQNIDVLYFGYYSVYCEKGISLKFEGKACHEISHDMPTSHNAMFFLKASFADNGFYDTSYRFSADYEWLCRNHSKIRTKYCGDKIVDYLQGGLSETRHLEVLREKAIIAKKYFGFKAFTWHIFNFLRILPVYVLKKVAIKLGFFHNYILTKHKIFGA